MAKELYIENFTDFTTGANVGEYFIRFPTRPSLKKMVNYGIPVEKQVFQRSKYEINGKYYYASDLIGDMWTLLPDKTRAQIFTEEWEKIHNGEWQIINGKTIYLNDFNYYFLNYYRSNTINYSNFWDSQWFYQLLLGDSFYASDVLGLMYVKGRRGGGTAPNNSAASKAMTTISNSNCGMMNYNLVKSNQVNFTPTKANILKLPDLLLPEPYLTARREGKLKGEKTTDSIEFPGVNNFLYTAPTVETAFDGQLIRLGVIDEPFKWPNTDPLVTMEKNLLCVKDGGIKHNIKDKVTGNILKYAGLVVFVSSVDEVADEQIQVVNNMYDVCSPETATDTWCSTYGARRYFEPSAFGLNGYMDKFGFSKFDEAQEYLDKEYENTLKNAGWEKAREFRRKNPRFIEDALTPSSAVCQFDFELLNKRREAIMDWPITSEKKPVLSQLEWIENMKTVSVKPMPEYRDFNVNAKFNISGHPDIPNNIQKLFDKKIPLNVGKYIASLDPIDYNKGQLNVNTKSSKPALRVKRILDMSIDGDKFDELGNPKNRGLDFETNRTVLTYFFRPDDTKDLWDDIAKVLIYYGCPLIYERTTRSVFDYLDERGMSGFFLDAKGNLITDETRDNYGIKTSEPAKRNYFDTTRNYINTFVNAERHIECIDQLITVTPKTMTKHDIATAYMILECIDSAVAYKYRDSISDNKLKEILSNLNFARQ
jgi:hypothetical protein